MIQSSDRSFWFGASDTDKVVGNWKTKTFESWWVNKMGLFPTENWGNKYTKAGTHYEHQILRSLGLPLVYDYQIKIPELSLRVNYDGILMEEKHIYECKTFKAEKEFKVSKTYWRQAQTEMFALETDKLDIVAYPMEEENYNNYFLPIDTTKLILIPIERNEKFIERELIPKLAILSDCLKKGIFPTAA